MKRILTVIVVAALNSICIEAVNGVDSIGCPESIIECQDIAEYADQGPEFPGGHAALLQFISQNFNFPDWGDVMPLKSKLPIKFVVTENGSIGDVKIIRSINPEVDQEVIRVVRMLPRFTPGQIAGKPANVWFTLPINFHFQR